MIWIQYLCFDDRYRKHKPLSTKIQQKTQGFSPQSIYFDGSRPEHTLHTDLNKIKTDHFGNWDGLAVMVFISHGKMELIHRYVYNSVYI